MPPEIFNLTQYCIGVQAQKFPDKTALIFTREIGKQQSWSYKELWETVSRLASGLQQLGLAPQSRIMIRMANSPDYTFIFMAAILAGYVTLPTYEGLTEEEALYILENSQSSLLIVSDDLKLSKKLPSFCREIGTQKLQELKQTPSLFSAPQTKANDPAILVYTSGSTGHPKGVLHAHRWAWGRRLICKHWLGIKERDILVHTDSLSWTYSFGSQLVDTWMSGATSLLYGGEKTSANWLKLLEHYRVTLFMSCPSTFVQILELNPKPIGSLRHGLSAGDVLKSETIDGWEKHMKVPLYQALGATEVNIFINTGPSVPNKSGSLGKFQEGRKVAILPETGDAILPGETGLLAVGRSDPVMMLGYWRNPQEEKERFRREWFLTGDLVRQDDEGYVYYCGRVGTLLKIDADLISPYEIEEVIGKHPAIHEIGCWSVPDEKQTPILAVFIVLKKGHTLTEEDVLNYAKKHLADFKCPKKVFFLSKLPRTSRGKLDRRKLGTI